MKRFRITKKQSFALVLVIACGIVPFILLGHYTPRWNIAPGYHPFYGVFENKVLSCGPDNYGRPQNATIYGIENLFVLDKTFGSFSFSQVKTIDIAWDVFVGRGVQLLAWWASYIVFSDALLRVIERHPASLRIFQRIALEGPSLLSIWTLMKEVWVAKSRRTKALFIYMFFATWYVLCVPMLMSAMTGYDSTNIAWVSLDDVNIVPASSLEQSTIIWGTKNATFDQNVCKSSSLDTDIRTFKYNQYRFCDCLMPNGTMISAVPNAYNWRYDDTCKFDFPGSTGVFRLINSATPDRTMNCNETMNIEIDNRSYDVRNLNISSGYCYNSVGYDYLALQHKSRCLPDTANAAYEWGFSTMMSGIFVFLHFGWCLSMYVVWQDAQFNSTLVKGGYDMTPLRAAFAISKAARHKTGLGERQLVRANTRELEQELYGTKHTKAAKVDHGLFVDDPEDVNDDDGKARRRIVKSKMEPSSSQETLT
ncbi:hypothetical protein BKA66DRAFT_574468 [Pyrenochaeta sp. MPI-SDFR-AT-0127]|nr:hypothetical protein BKA66DRAFT_574468 [Pyrenochaeta sp. MPI-SDFR-AT-0127]